MSSIFLQVDFESDIPIYLQLKDQIIKGIALGQLKAGEQLPSVRQLAGDLGINLHTVNKAYNLLKQEGYVIIHRKKGVVVGSAFDSELGRDYLNQLEKRLKPLIIDAYCRGLTVEDFEGIFHKIIKELEEEKGQ